MNSLYIIFPLDPTTHFLQSICDSLSGLSNYEVKVIQVKPSLGGYGAAMTAIEAIPDNALILFLGHGTSSELYGGASQDFIKKPLIKRSEMIVFQNKRLIILACNSIKLIHSTIQNTPYANAMGFEVLPSELSETRGNSKLKDLKITEEVIEQYKQVLVELISRSISYYCTSEARFDEFYFYLKLLINKKICELVYTDKNPVLADLLFETREGSDYY